MNPPESSLTGGVPQAEAPPRARGGKRVLLLLASMVVVWGLLMRQFGGADVYAVMGPYALAVIVVVWLLRGRKLRSGLQLKGHALAGGLSVGVLMTVATYPAFQLATQLIPGLDGQVRGLYAAAGTGSLAIALAWVCALIAAEELLWRGALQDLLEQRMPRSLASALSVLSYALAQLGSGSLVVFALAVVCGSVWTLQRNLHGSLVPSLIAHTIWTPTVILLYPVT